LEYDMVPLADELEATQRAHEILRAINGALPQDHWVKRFGRSAITESEAPREGDWRLSFLAPWSLTADFSAALPSDRLSLIVDWNALAQSADPQAAANACLSDPGMQPAYWRLIEEYQRRVETPAGEWIPEVMREHAKGPDAAIVNQVVGLAAGTHFLRPDVKPNPPPTRQPDSDADPVQLTLRFTLRWTLGATGDLPAGTDLASLRNRVEAVMNAPLTIVLSLAPNGRVVNQSPDAASVVQTLARTMPGAMKLKPQPQPTGPSETRPQPPVEDSSPPIPQPAGLAQQLDQRLAGRAGIQLDQATSFEVLKGIWAAKGTGPPAGVSNLAGVSESLRRKYAGENQPDPTIFIEFYCSANTAYALTWSASWGGGRFSGGGGIQEGPMLLRFDAPGGQSALLNTILDSAVPVASGAKVPFSFVLGIVVGADACLAGIENAPLNRRSQLEVGLPDTRWTSLAELNELHHGRNLPCSAWVRPSLGGP
jgi:hypothetical protein